jgi:hypothetical protein
VQKTCSAGVVSQATRLARRAVLFPSSTPFLLKGRRNRPSKQSRLFRYLLRAWKRAIQSVAAFVKSCPEKSGRSPARVFEIKNRTAASEKAREHKSSNWIVKL